MKQLKKDLQAVAKEFEILTKKTKKVTDQLKKKAVDQLGKARGAIKPEVAARRTVQTLKNLTKTMDKIIKAVEKFEKEQTAKKPKPKAKARTAKKAAPKRRTATKKATTLTATDRVINIVKRSKKGVDVPTLMKKTGYDETKVRNIVSRVFKQKKIKRFGRGLYVGA